MIFFYIVGWLIFSQQILLRVFTCCKRKKKIDVSGFISNRTLGSPWPILSAHRGGSAERVENTVEAFRNAVTSYC